MLHFQVLEEITSTLYVNLESSNKQICLNEILSIEKFKYRKLHKFVHKRPSKNKTI